MHRLRGRSAAAFSLLAFSAGTLLSPHRHLNPMTDLITDAPSDSGLVVLTRARFVPGSASFWDAPRSVEDAPCLACFWHDMAATAARVFSLCVVSVMLAIAAAQRPERRTVRSLPPSTNRGPPP